MAVPEPIWLRAESEAAAKAALPMFVDAETGDWWPDLGHAGCLDIIGAIDGAAGWHANANAVDDDLRAAIIASGLVIPRPNNPARVPAGWQPE